MLIGNQKGTLMAVQIKDYPQLQLLSWNMCKESVLSEAEALSLYERNWHLVDQNQLDKKEKDLIDHLVRSVGNGVFHV